MNKKMVELIGIILGIVIIIIGFSVQSAEVHSVGSAGIKFGADFYTEMYSVTRSVGYAVNTAAESICKAIGALIIAIGLFDIAYFAAKFFSNEENTINTPTNSSYAQSSSASSTTSTPTTATITASGRWICKCGVNNPGYVVECECGATKPLVKSVKATPAPSSNNWTCTCGRQNANYVTTCTCGINKRDIIK